ncbi:MAG: MCE family protein [Deltaproteobacteria bacterium]|nr:MAG: MCE family protein [Deltaproteobacteria bacterium]
MGDDRRLGLVVGAFVLAALAMLAGLILSLSSERGLFAKRYTLVARFGDVQGLLPGAPVRLAGKDVGAIQSVRFAPLGDARPPVEVLLQIDADVKSRIRSDSQATIGTIGLLGDTYVEIEVGTPEGAILEAGDELPAVTPLNVNRLVAKGTTALDSIVELTDNLNTVVAGFGERMGSERFIEALDAITTSVESVTDIVNEVQTGQGLLHSLIYSHYEGSGVENVEKSLATLERILAEVETGRGVLHTLIYDEPEEQDIVMQALAAGGRLNNILEKVDGGQGTLGLLVNDPTLYEDLVSLLGGAQRSLVVRSLIRMSTEDGN